MQIPVHTRKDVDGRKIGCTYRLGRIATDRQIDRQIYTLQNRENNKTRKKESKAKKINRIVK